MHRTHRALVARIAALAVLLGAVAPSLAQVLGARPDAGALRADICTSGGRSTVQSLADDAAERSTPLPAVSSFDGPCCVTHGGVLALPPVLRLELLAPLAEGPGMPVAKAVRRAAWVWSSARPRAPPVAA